jgi:chromosome segregation ATPase
MNPQNQTQCAGENRQLQSTVAQLRRQLSGREGEMDAAKQEATHLHEAQLSSQMQLQQYVVDIQALERNCDTLTRELHSSKQEADDLARDRNRVLEQMQAAQVWNLHTVRLLNSKK